jgi:hypothetical protein
MTTDTINKNGFNPKHWGSHLWRVLHIMALNYRPTPAHKKAFKQFVESLKVLLPCKICRDHFNKCMSTGGLRLDRQALNSRESLFKWSVDLHNCVNAISKKNTNKKKSLQHWLKYYERKRAVG